MSLSELDQIVAGSYGTIQKLSAEMDELIQEYEEQERDRLSKDMPKRKITICQDETFHPENCLVAKEPVSNYILLEKYSESRDAQSWTKELADATKGLPVEIIQSVSDEATGLLKHVKTDLEAHHSPDLFHVI
jgi:hypothetical protein